jgi:hypothetical protein
VEPIEAPIDSIFEYGIGVDEMRVSDKVCFLFGPDSPVVLRPVGNGNQYQILGDVWIEGYKDGSEDHGEKIKSIKTAGEKSESEYFDLI